MELDVQPGQRIITLNFLWLGEDTCFHCNSFWCIMMNPRFITSNNMTQKFVLMFSILSDKRLNRHQFTVACVRQSVALGPIWQILWKILDAREWLSQQNQHSGSICQLFHKLWHLYQRECRSQLDWSVIAVCGTPARTSSPTDWRSLQKRVHYSNTLERDKVLLNTADNLWWISAFATLSATRNFTIILWPCWTLTSIVYIWIIMMSWINK